jgi:hypothetical protein
MVRFYAGNRRSPSVIGTWKGLVYYSLTKVDYKPPRGGRGKLREVNAPESILDNIRMPDLAPISISISQEQINRTTQVGVLVLATAFCMALTMQSAKLSMQNI